MALLVYFNGVLIPEDEVAISPKDRSFLYGEGLFETLKADAGFVPFLPEHLERFFGAFSSLGFSPQYEKSELEHAIYRTLQQNGLEDAYLRMNLSRENQKFGSMEASDQYNLLILPAPLLGTDLSETVRAVLFSQERLPVHSRDRVKSTNYLVYLLAKKFAEQQQCDEAILLNDAGRIVEGASSNLFIWNGRAWQTPELGEGPLPGVMRRVLMDLLHQEKIPCQEVKSEPAHLADAEEMILCNAVRGVRVVSQWEGKAVGDGKEWPQARRLQRLLADEIGRRRQKFQSPNWTIP